MAPATNTQIHERESERLIFTKYPHFESVEEINNIRLERWQKPQHTAHSTPKNRRSGNFRVFPSA
jgi:hypothetical protein